MGKKKARQLALKKSTKASSKSANKKVSSRKKPASSKASSIREDTERLKFALLTSRIGIWEMDLKTKHIVWDEAVYIILGLERSAFKNTFKEYINLIHPDDRAISKKTIENAIKNNVEFHIEHRVFRRGNEIVWIEGMGKAILDKKGHPIKLIGTVTEITNRRNAENEKQEWKTRYELIAASSGQVIYDYDTKSGNIVWGGNVKELLGYHKSEMGDINKWISMVHPNDRNASLEKLDEAEKKISHYDVIYQFCHKEGHYLTMHDSGFFLAGVDGKAYRMLGMMRDITEIKRAEDELKESEERYRTFLGASFSGIGIHDLGVFIEVNQGLADVSGYSVEELTGMQSLQIVAPEYRPIVIDRIKSGDETPYDIEAIHKDGSKRYLEIHGKNIPYKNKIVRVTEFRDVTDRKIAEEKILEQNERLSSIAQSLTKKNDQLEEFTQIVSHNLRAPVGNIMSLLAILGGSNEVDERNKVLKLLERSSNYLLTTLTELNDILKVKQDIHLEKQNLKFEEVFEKVKQMMTVRINETSVKLKCDFDLAPAINYPNIYLESIFLNLLSNSLKYRNPNRNLEVNFRTYYNGHRLFMEVSDNGLGIDLNRYRHQVFKLRKTFHENAESRGVGLFLIKTQIETMGGEISITSEENIGTTFAINFNKEDS